MKIIDLLNKIANGDEVPQKIKWEDIIFAYNEYDKDYLEYPFSDEEYKGLFNMKDSILTQFLNDEVEIIEEKEMCHKCHKYPVEYNQTWCDFCLGISKEEKKIPEKLGYQDNANGTFYLNRKKYNSEPIKILSKKMNEIINYLDYLKSKGE